MRNSLPFLLLGLMALCRPAPAGSGAHGYEIDGLVAKPLGQSVVSYCVTRDEGVSLSAEQAKLEIEEAVREWREFYSARGYANPQFERITGPYRVKLKFPNDRPFPIALNAEFVQACSEPTEQIQFRFSRDF